MYEHMYPCNVRCMSNILVKNMNLVCVLYECSVAYNLYVEVYDVLVQFSEAHNPLCDVFVKYLKLADILFVLTVKLRLECLCKFPHLPS